MCISKVVANPTVETLSASALPVKVEVGLQWLAETVVFSRQRARQDQPLPPGLANALAKEDAVALVLECLGNSYRKFEVKSHIGCKCIDAGLGSYGITRINEKALCYGSIEV